MKKIYKKLLATALLSLAPLLLASSSTPVEAAPANVSMSAYEGLISRTALSKLTTMDIAEIKRTAPQLEEISDWNRQVAYYLGAKEYALSTMWTPQRIQLVTPYSLTRYLYYLADKELVAPDKELLEEIAQHKDVAWVWVWSNGNYNVLNNNPAPTIENVVIRSKDNDYYYHLDKKAYIPHKAMAAANLNTAQLWPFPARVFSQGQIPFEIVLLDSADNRKPLKITKDDLAKCK